MIVTFDSRKTSSRFRVAAIALILVFQIACAAGPPVGLYHETSCTPAEVVSQARQKLSSMRVATSEPVAEGKGLSITSDYIIERHGKEERMSKYKLVVMPVENANKSTVSLQQLEGKSKGIRERKWYDDDDSASEPEAAQQIWDQIKTICVPKQP
jgi:hypothetical protein